MDFNEILRSYADFNIKLSQAIKSGEDGNGRKN